MASLIDPIIEGQTADLWFTRCGGATASTIAIRNGWLEDEFGRDGTVIRSLAGADTLAARNSHFDHHVSALFREGGNIPPIWARSLDQDTVVVGITWIDEYQGIIVRADSGIRAVHDLAGKRLALPRHDVPIDFLRGAATKGFLSALSIHDISPDDVRFVDIDGGPIDPGKQTGPDAARAISAPIEALRKGEVDAVFARQGYGVALSRLPELRGIIDLGSHPDPAIRVNNGSPRPITVGRSFADARPDLVARYLSALLRAADWAAGEPAQTVRLIAAEAGRPDDETSVVEGYVSGFHAKLRPALTDAYIHGLEIQKDFLLDRGFLDADFEIRDWIRPEPLAEAERLLANTSR